MSDLIRDQFDPPENARLHGNLGVAAIVLMVVAAAAPLTTLAGNVPLMIALGQGVGAPVGFLVAGGVFGLFAAGFVAMTHYVNKAGAFYAYIERGLGRRAGVASALVAYAAYMSTMLAVYGFIGAVLSTLVSDFGGPSLPWWVMSFVVMGACGFLGYRHIELSAKVLGVFLVSEIAVVVILDAVIFVRGGTHGITFDSFTPAGIGEGFGVAVLFSLFGFVGVEATAIFRDEAKDPQRTIRRATYWAVGIIAVFYAISSWALIEGNGGSDAVAIATEDPDNFTVNTAGVFLGMVGKDITQVLLVVSLFAAALSFHNISARYKFVLAEQGIYPASWGTAHERHRAPSRASLVVSALSVVIIGLFAILHLDPLLEIFGPMGGVGITGLAALWLLTALAVTVFFARKKGMTTTTVVGGLAVIALSASMILIIVNLPVIVGGTVLLAVLMGLVPLVFFVVGFVMSTRVAPRHDAGSLDESDSLAM
ncbi:APC family permease [Mycolicibacterium komossense]|uniref:APC family permease n=1 Tax=Mycolicibacterium komossense TaxID=1779 RepID=A0ABT3CHU4_9MYCO|nr:APC family permease [Mycolicibacterium komossense]MCV7229065.1 APC family permease [Mycolicibacterium komossense]